MASNRTTFFHLPIEIRDQVYLRYFTTKYGVIEVFLEQRPVAILRTCQQVYNEAAAVLYGQHIFYFSDRRRMDQPYFTEVRESCAACTLKNRKSKNSPSSNTHDFHILNCNFVRLGPWVATIGPRNASMIRNLHLHFWGQRFVNLPKVYKKYGVPSSNKAKKAFLREITCEDTENGALLLKRGLNMLVSPEITGLKHVKITFAANVLEEIAPTGVIHTLILKEFCKLFLPGLDMEKALEIEPTIEKRSDEHEGPDEHDITGVWEWEYGVSKEKKPACETANGEKELDTREKKKQGRGVADGKCTKHQAEKECKSRWSKPFVQQGHTKTQICGWSLESKPRRNDQRL